MAYEDLTVPELKDLLRERGLPLSGKKADLIARLSDAEEPQEPQERQEPQELQEHQEPKGAQESSGEPQESPRKKSQERGELHESPGWLGALGPRIPQISTQHRFSNGIQILIDFGIDAVALWAPTWSHLGPTWATLEAKLGTNWPHLEPTGGQHVAKFGPDRMYVDKGNDAINACTCRQQTLLSKHESEDRRIGDQGMKVRRK